MSSLFAKVPVMRFPVLKGLILCILGFFECIFFSKSTFSKSPFRNSIRVSNNLILDQARHLFGPDLAPRNS